MNGRRVLPRVPDLRAMRAAEDSVTPERPTIAALIDQYLVWKSGTAAKNTIRTYKDGLRHFAEFLALSGIDAFIEDCDALPSTILEAHIVWLRQRSNTRTGRALAATAIATYHAAALDLFKYAVRRHLVPNERFRWAEMQIGASETLGKIRKRSAHHDRRIPLIVAYVDALPLPERDKRLGLSRVELLRDRALLHLLISSGIRREEAVSLNRADVEDGWATSTVIVGKGSKERTIFWDTDTQHALKRYLEARADTFAPLFIRLDNRRGVSGRDGENWRLTPQSCALIVRRYSKATGIPATTHMFRHSMASVLLNNGAPLSLIQDLLGHADVSTTKNVYAVYEQQTLRKGFDEFNQPVGDQVAVLLADQQRRQESGV